METVFRVYYDHAAHSAAVVQCPEDARYADFGPVGSTCVDEFATEAEAEQRVKELTRCDARERGVYCYTHNPGCSNE